MKEIILCKHGELALKGLNFRWFEELLLRDIRAKLARAGRFSVRSAQCTIYIEPADADQDVGEAFDIAAKTFGISALSRAVITGKDMTVIKKTAAEYLPRFLDGKKTFRAEAKRSDKTFPIPSPAIAAEIGGALLEVMPELKVDLKNPEITIRAEIREKAAYITAGQIKGAGGMPYGTNGKGLVLLSGGIDSPVAAYMIAKRGVCIEALHFESFPYTSEKALEKVMELAGVLSEYCGKISVHTISLTKIQEELRRTCEEKYFTLLLRRSMMRLAERTAGSHECDALITGESIGQVASQTMRAIEVTDAAASAPVFRPCIGMDKEEIVTIARKIGTYDISVLPYEDCCTIFTPKHPKTRPELEKVLEQETLLELQTLENDAFSTLTTKEVKKL